MLSEVDPLQHPSRLAILIHLLEEIPVQHGATETSRSARLMARGAVLAVFALLVYLPCFWTGLHDEEGDRLRRLIRPEPQINSLRQIEKWFDPGPRVPNLLRILLYAERGPEGSAGAFQIMGVCLHPISVVLLWLMLRRLQQPAAWLAALLFAVHPAGTNAVAWVSQQGRLWAGMFSLLGILLLFKNRRVPTTSSPDHPEYFADSLSPAFENFKATLTDLGAMAAFVLAALCQPTSAVTAIVGVTLVCWKNKVAWADALLLFPLLVIGIGPTFLSMRNSASHLVIHTSTVLYPAGRVVADALLLHSTRVPWIDASSVTNNIACGIGAIIVISLPITLLLYRKVGGGVAMTILSLLLLLPTLIAPVGVHLVGQNLQGTINPGEGYLAQIPIIVLVANAIFQASLRLRDELHRAISQATAGLILAAAMGISTWINASAFGSNEHVLKSAIAAEPQSTAARSRLAEYYLSLPTLAGVQLAREQMRNVRMDQCNDADTAVAEGDLLLALGDSQSAIQWYQHGQAVDSLSIQPAGHLAALYTRQNRIADAVACYQDALGQHPDNPALKNDFGLLLSATGQTDKAVEQFRSALSFDPDYVPAHVNLANALIAQHKLSEAAAELQQTVFLDPDNYEAFHNAGVVLAQLHDYERSIRMLTTSVQLKPDSVEARNDLGAVLVAAGKYNRAIFEFHLALKKAPNYEPAIRNLAVAQRKLADQNSLSGTGTPK